MNIAKNTLLILLALFIDGLQATISWGIMVIAAFPGTTGGAALGCLVGNYTVGQAGCWLGGGFLGILGSIPIVNATIATATVPVGIVLGFAINMCLSIALGWCFLVPLLYLFNGVSWKRLIWGSGEMIPGINNIPFWTALVVLSILSKRPAQTGMVTKILAPSGMAGMALFGVAKTKEDTAELREQRAPNFTWGRQQNDWLSEEAAQANNPQQKRATVQTRNIINDIRPIKALAIIALFFVSPFFLHAQAIDPVQFTVTPEVPGPNEQVTINIAGIGTFLGDATITWQQDGKTTLSGKGERIFSFRVGGLGVQTRVRATIVSAEKGTISRDFVFIPSKVELIWEASTSVPPMYRGKALYSAGSTIKVVAFPSIVANGSTISSNNLSFQWSRGGDPLPGQSGTGRNILSLFGSQLKQSEQVGVEIYLGGVKVSRGNIVVPATSPSVVLYGKDPLRGVVYESAIPSSISLGTNELTAQAEPYFFSKESVGNSLLYTWKLNGTETTGPDTDKGILTLRQSGSGAGQATLSVDVQNTSATQFIQKASAAVRIVFGGVTSGTSSFGL